MPGQASRLECCLLATAAMGLALAVTAPYREAQSADICGAGLTTITTPQLPADNCTLDAGESIEIQAGGEIEPNFTTPIEIGNNANSIVNAGTITANSEAITNAINTSASF